MLHLSDVVERFLPQLSGLSPQQHKVCHQMTECRTQAMGGLQLQCYECGQQRILYHACRNRHCPRCQQRASQQWQQRERQNVVDAPYFHLVFTLPHELNGWVRLHPRLIYSALFSAAWETLNTLGHDPKRLNGQLGMTAVLHTWGQNLSQHVHLHCLLPGGVLDDQQQWHPAKSSYLFPVKVLSRVFRGKLVSELRSLRKQGKLHRITQRGSVSKTLALLMAKDWVVYAKPCLHKAETVVAYLSRYTRRIALNESRLLAINDETVSFRYKDYRDGQKKVMTLSGSEFLRRFLQHVLPNGFMRIRHFGWLANACRRQKLPQVRQAITAYQTQQTEQSTRHDKPPVIPLLATPTERFTGLPCDCCPQGQLRVRFELPRPRLEGG